MNTADQRGQFESLQEELAADNDFGSLQEVLDNNPSELTELLETGSVTLNMLGRKFELTLNVKEVS